MHNEDITGEIAVIGLAGRFPGAGNIDSFWNNLKSGVESVAFFNDEELIKAGISLSDIKKSNYVRAKAYLDDSDKFDAEFFGYSNREAKWMDPQHRIFLETTYHALENAGYDPYRYQGEIGIFASSSFNTYLLQNISNNPNLLREIGKHHVTIANGNDFLATKVAYKLNLKGPAQTIQTACSSSLVGVHHACQSLLNFQCDIALAGGISITVPIKSGYFYIKDSIASPNGHCYPFDERAKGTLTGNGVGVVVLKRLEEAISDGDHIYAIVKGSAINNDGSNKVGYTAPSIKGQADVISIAQAIAGVHPETINYIETHGTGTMLGDPIEIAGLTKAFSLKTNKKQFCTITSSKANIGHLDAAAGIAGFIRVVLSLYHKQIAPSINYNKANEKINFSDTPFYVNNHLQHWQSDYKTRRAGISSFGIGGTNAHVILEEALPNSYYNNKQDNSWYILPISAKTKESLELQKKNLIHYLQQDIVNLSNVSHTLHAGRSIYGERACLVARSNDATRKIEVIETGIDLKGTVKILDGDKSNLTDNDVENISSWLDGRINSLKTPDKYCKAKRAPLPLYPFICRPFWLTKNPEDAKSTTTVQIINNTPPQQQSDNKKTLCLTDKITSILSRLLDKQQIDIHEEFDSIGADSLLLLDFSEEIKKNLNIDLSLDIFASHNSITKLSCFLANRKYNNFTTFNIGNTDILPKLAVKLKNGDNSRKPLFCIHPAGGVSTVFMDLARNLDLRQPVIGIQASGWDGIEDGDDNIEAMANRYLNIIKQIQPRGPYMLCGSSLGGTIAFEIALNLKKDSNKTAILAMLDSPPPSIVYTTGYKPGNYEEILGYIKTLSPKMYDNLKKMEQERKGTLQRFLYLWTMHHEAPSRYQPAEYDDKVIYFRAKERNIFLAENLEQGWMPFCNGAFEIYQVPGNHLTMHHAPNVNRVANVLNNLIAANLSPDSSYV